MNLLDENTKARLDAGSAVMLDGKYLIISPETFQAMLNGAVPVQTTDEEANYDFIEQGFKCHFCGKENDYSEYIMTVVGCYDSDHDYGKGVHRHMRRVSGKDACGGELEKVRLIL